MNCHAQGHARAKARQALRNEGLVQAWLFQNDGRFALKTLANRNVRHDVAEPAARPQA